MPHDKPDRPSRREFLAGASAVGAGLLITHGQARTYAANERLQIALIGCGGRGSYFVEAIPEQGHVFAALCDVNRNRARQAFERFPDVPKFEDYRVMLHELDDQTDAVIISTPDHTHAAPSAAALRAGKPVFCEKPLTHSVHEARVLTELAAETGLPTQMGNQAGYDVRAVETVLAGQIGEVREVHAWNGSGGPGRRDLPRGADQVPDHLNWDLWLGPAKDRPYHHQWMGGHHMGWRDFRTGELGQWGSHMLATVFKAMKLDTLWQTDTDADGPRPIIRVTAECPHRTIHTYPRWEVVHWEFPARGDQSPLRFHWYNGAPDQLPREYHPVLLETHVIEETEGGSVDLAFRHMGSVFVGSELLLHVDGRGTHMQVHRKDEPGPIGVDGPPQVLPRPLGGKAEQGWIDAIRGGPAPSSRFAFSGPFTEFYLLGNVATLFPDETLEYDPIAGRIVNHDEADAAVRPPYRDGWTLRSRPRSSGSRARPDNDTYLPTP